MSFGSARFHAIRLAMEAKKAGDSHGIATPGTPHPVVVGQLYVERIGRRSKGWRSVSAAAGRAHRQGKAWPEMDRRTANRQLQGTDRQTGHEAAAQRLPRRTIKLAAGANRTTRQVSSVTTATCCPLWIAEGTTP